MGVVYKARQTRLNRVVALKMILAGGHAGEADLARFRTEAEAVARLQHPNIVQIFEVGEQNGLPFFSLEFCASGSLDRKLNGTPLPAGEAAGLVQKLARAVQAAHEKGVIHRDLKPANVLLAEDGTPKVTDFGLAKKLDEEGQTQSGAVMGTPSYMAPEQAGGKSREIGPAADVYSLGAILYECLTGRPPFKAATWVETLRQVIADEPAPPRQLQSNTPRDLETICLKCLRKEPTRRYETALDLADDLRRFLAGESIRARTVGVWERTWKWVRRRPMAALLALTWAVGLTLLVIGLALFAGQRDQLAHAAEAREKQAHDAEAAEKAHGLQLEQEQKKIADQRDRARDNLTQARQAIGELLEVSEKGIPNEPHLEGLRERILVFARDLAHNLLAQQSDDPEVQAQAAETTRLVGDIEESLNKYDDAASSYAAAAGLYEALLKGPGPKPVWREEAAGNYVNSAKVLMVRGRGDDARKALDRAAELYQALAKDYPDDAAYQSGLALCWNSRGIQALLGGDAPRARQGFEEALRLFEQMPSDEQRRPETQLAWAKTENNLGTLLQKDRHFDEAEAKYRQALDRLKPLVLAQPDAPAYQKEFGPIYISLGALLSGEGPKHYDAAQAVYDDAIHACTELGDKFSGVADYRYLLAEAFDGRGELFLLRGDEGNARADLGRACDLLKQLPNRSEYRIREAWALNHLGRAESKTDPDAARRSWEQALALCEALPEADRRTPDARAAYSHALLRLIDWRQDDARKAAKAERLADAAADLRAVADLWRKRLASFSVPAEAAAASAVGDPAAALVLELAREDEHGDQVSILMVPAPAQCPPAPAPPPAPARGPTPRLR